MNARQTSDLLAQRMEALCSELLSAGKRIGTELRIGNTRNEPGNSLRVHLVGPNAGQWRDFATDEHGDALDLIKARMQLETREAIRWSKCFLGIDDQSPTRRMQSDAPSRWSTRANDIWRQCMPVRGTIGSAYFANRGCIVPLSDDVRFHSGLHHWLSKTTWPALVARITDSVSGDPLSLHFTFIDPDRAIKAPVEPAKLLLPKHQKSNGVIRLIEDAEVTSGLGIAEGCETSLSVMAAGWRPVWAVIDSGNMAAFPVLPGIEILTIFADNDEAGLKAAEQAADRWLAAGREVRICKPPKRNMDWNDILCEARRAGTK